MHLTPTTFKCLHFPSFKNSWHYVYMPKTILSHGISPILYALGNEELEHIQYKQIHTIKQAQMAELLGMIYNRRQQKLIYYYFSLCKIKRHTLQSEICIKWKSIAWIVATFSFFKGYQWSNHYMEVLSSKASPQWHTVLHLLIAYRIYFK